MDAEPSWNMEFLWEIPCRGHWGGDGHACECRWLQCWKAPSRAESVSVSSGRLSQQSQRNIDCREQREAAVAPVPEASCCHGKVSAQMSDASACHPLIQSFQLCWLGVGGVLNDLHGWAFSALGSYGCLSTEPQFLGCVSGTMGTCPP